MPNGKLRGAIARQFWRSRGEETAGQTRRRERAEAHLVVREETQPVPYDEALRLYYGPHKHTVEYWAEPAPFTTETGE